MEIKEFLDKMHQTKSVEQSFMVGNWTFIELTGQIPNVYCQYLYVKAAPDFTGMLEVPLNSFTDIPRLVTEIAGIVTCQTFTDISTAIAIFYGAVQMYDINRSLGKINISMQNMGTSLNNVSSNLINVSNNVRYTSNNLRK